MLDTEGRAEDDEEREGGSGIVTAGAPTAVPVLAWCGGTQAEVWCPGHALC